MTEEFYFNVSDYTLQSVIGKGAYGIVAMAVKNGTNETVAIKKVEPFHNDKNLFALRTLREVKLLKYFNHPNIIKLVDYQKPKQFEQFNEIYLMLEYMDADLHSVIRTHQLSDRHITYMLYQLMKGVKYLHSAGVIHRDLKPANLLVNELCDLKICDFGLARLENDQILLAHDNALTEYVATRWYRAPEVMLNLSKYTKSMDIWAIGCILSEMILREPFFPGKDYKSQLLLIFEVLGTPENEDLNTIKLPRARQFIEKHITHQRKIPMRKIFKGSNPLAIDLIEKTLVFNPEKRLTIEECLDHPYISEFRDVASEISAQRIPANYFMFDQYKEELNNVDLKRLLYTELIY